VLVPLATQGYRYILLPQQVTKASHRPTPPAFKLWPGWCK